MDSVENNLLHSQVWPNTKGQYMKESNTLADNANIKQNQKDILFGTKRQCMKESDTLAGNATIKQLQRVILLNKKGQSIRSKIPLKTE